MSITGYCVELNRTLSEIVIIATLSKYNIESENRRSDNQPGNYKDPPVIFSLNNCYQRISTCLRSCFGKRQCARLLRDLRVGLELHSKRLREHKTLNRRRRSFYLIKHLEDIMIAARHHDFGWKIRMYMYGLQI